MLKPSLNPFAAWSSLALTGSEMLVASAEVITRRVHRMAVSDPIPNADDQREFTLMGQEKVEAGAESLMAMGAYLFDIHHEVSTQALTHMMDLSQNMTALMTSQTASEALTHQARLADSLTRGAMQAADLSGKAAVLTERGLKPVHRRAVANARRLSREG